MLSIHDLQITKVMKTGKHEKGNEYNCMVVVSVKQWEMICFDVE